MLVVFKLLFGFFGLKAAAYLGESPLAGIGVGVIVGHILDHTATYRLARYRAQKAYNAQSKKAFEEHFLQSLFLMFGQLCLADGVVTQGEMHTVETIMKDMLKLDRRARHKALQIFQSSRNSPVSFQTCAVRFFEIYKLHPQVLESTIQLLFQLALADGALKDAEERLIHAAATVFGFSEEKYQHIRASCLPSNSSNRSTNSGSASGSRSSTNSSSSTGSNQNSGGYSGSSSSNGNEENAISEIDHCYEILGCSKTDSDAKIKQSYRKLVLDYHPDKIASKDLPEEFTKFATKKFQDIQNAYESIKAHRGI